MADPVSWAVAAYATVKATVAVAATNAALSAGISMATAKLVGAAAVTAFKFAGITALSVASNALFAPQVGAAGAPTEWRSDPNAGLPFIAGRLGVGGNLIYSKEFGADNRYLGNVTLYSRAGPVHSMGPFYADGVNITFGAGGVATNGGNIAGNMWLSSQGGLQPQPTALPLPGALSAETFTGWTANHKLSGCAADLQVLRQDSKFQTYPSGQPRRYRVIEGIKVYDPRLDGTYPGGEGACRLNDRATYVYTANPIIQALNWCIGYYENGKPVGGLADPLGPTLDGIDVEAFIAAANIADANDWTGLGARYSSADEKHQVLLAFLQAGGALYSENAGRISCVSRGAVKTSVMTLTRADTAGPVTVDAMPPRRVVINSLIPRCIQETYQWEPVDLAPVTVASLVTADGGVRRRNKDFPFVTSSVQASQLAALDILDARETLSGSTTFKPYVRDMKPGDAFTWNEPGFFLNGVKCVVMERSYDPASDTVEITWRSETDSKIAFALGLDPAPPVFPSLTSANPSFVPVPSTDDWTVTGGTIGSPGFVEGPAITLDGDVEHLTNVTHIIVDFKADGDTEWTHHGEFPLAGFKREQITGRLPNTPHDIRLRYRNEWGVIDDSQARVFEAITTGAQVVQSALDAAPGSALAQELDDRAREIRREAEDRLAETATLAAVLLSEARIRADDDSLQRFEIIRVDRRAGDAQARAEDIITLTLDPSSALIQRFTEVEAEAGDALAGVAANQTAIADEASARAAAITTVTAGYTAADAALGVRIDGAETDIAARATIAQLQLAEADARRAVARLFEEQTATFATTLAAITRSDETRAEQNAALVFRIDRSEARISGAEASVLAILNLEVGAGTALAQEFASLNASVSGLTTSVGGLDTRLTTAEAGVSSNSTAIANEASARATAISNLEAAYSAADTALGERIDGAETDIAARALITSLQDAEASASRARARLLEDLQASLATALGAIRSLRDVTAEDGSVSAFRIDETRATLNGVSAQVTDISNAVVDLETATATRIQTVEAGAAFAGVSFLAKDSDGDITADIRFAAQVIGFGETFAAPRFVIDTVGEEVVGLNAAGTVKTFQLGLDDGRLRLRSAAGALMFDAQEGGLLLDGVPANTITQRWIVSSTGNIDATATTDNQLWVFLSTPYQNKDLVAAASFMCSGYLQRLSGSGSAIARLQVRSTASDGGAPFGDWTTLKSIGFSSSLPLSLFHFVGLIGEWWQVAITIEIATSGDSFRVANGYVEVEELRR